MLRQLVYQLVRMLQLDIRLGISLDDLMSRVESRLGRLDTAPDIRREEFDRRTNIMRRQGVVGLKWTEPLGRFAYVQVFRGYTVRGTRETCVNLGRREPRETAMLPEYIVAAYFSPSEDDEKEAREWGQRLALFLNLPLCSQP